MPTARHSIVSNKKRQRGRQLDLDSSRRPQHTLCGIEKVLIFQCRLDGFLGSLLAVLRARYCAHWYGEIARVAVSASDALRCACDISSPQDEPGGQAGAGQAHGDAYTLQIRGIRDLVRPVVLFPVAEACMQGVVVSEVG